MIDLLPNPSEKRAALRAALKSGKLLRFPGAFSPLAAMAIAEATFDGVYCSGAVMANELGYPDIGLTTLTEIAARGRQIARATKLPTIIDVDTGFGEPLNAYRTVQEIEDAGLAGCHIEDQINPKRCGQLDGKGIIDTASMVRKVKAATAGRRDPNFVVIGRTDARGVEGFDAAVERAKAYVDAGADMIFPEALADERELGEFREAVGPNVPLLANMTEFGKSKLLDANTLESLGYNIVIYPVTLQRVAMRAIVDALAEIRERGTQAGLVEEMQTRAELYALLKYEKYSALDADIFNFTC